MVYYELKRELLRARRSFGVARLDAFIAASTGRYLPLSDEALRLAAELWASVRQEGRPTADSKALDIVVIIAAQALSFGAAPSDITVVTNNANHLSRSFQFGKSLERDRPIIAVKGSELKVL